MVDNLVPEERIRAITFQELPLHDTMWSLAIASDGTIYFGVCGELIGGLSVHLYSYYPQKNRITELADLSKVFNEPNDSGFAPQSKIHYSLCPGPDGKVYGATHCTGAPWGFRTWSPLQWWDHPKHRFPGSHFFAYDSVTGNTCDYGIILPNEGCRVLTLDAKRMRFFGVSFPRSYFFVYDLASRELKNLGRISNINPQDIFLDREGNAYTTDDFGYLIRCNTETLELEHLPVRIPSPKFCKYGFNTLYNTVTSKDGRIIYGIAWSGNPHLFTYEPELGHYGSITDLGPIFLPDQDRWDTFEGLNICGGLILADDGWLYAAQNDSHSSPMGRRLVRINPQTGQRENLGLIKVDGLIAPYICRGVQGHDGTLYFAECVRQPVRLILYRPPSRKPFDEWKEPERILRNTKRHFPPKELQGICSEVSIDQMDNVKEVAYELSEFITGGSLVEGQTELRTFGRFGQNEDIAPDARSICGMVINGEGCLFGLTRGARSHFFSYDHSPLGQYIVNLGILYEGLIFSGGLTVLDTGDILVWVNPQSSCETHLWRYTPTYAKVWFRGRIDGDLRKLTVLPKKVWALASSGKHIAAFIENDTLVYFDQEMKEKETIAIAGPHSAKPILIADGVEGFIGTWSGQELLHFVPENKSKNELVRLNSGYITALSAKNGMVAYGTSEGELVVKLLEAGSTQRQGKTSWRKPVRCVCLGNDGLVWAFSGSGVGHLFRYAANDTEPISLWVPVVNFPYYWIFYDIECMVSGKKGELYMAETGRLAHLLIYRP